MSSNPMKSLRQYETECRYLYSFFSGNGRSEGQKLVEIFSRRSQELKAICQTYSALYGHDLLRVISSNQKSSALNRLAYLRVSDPQSRDAEILRKLLLAGSINLGTLIEITCTRSSSELHHIKQQYHSRYQSDLERDISMKVSGGFKEILAAVCKSCRNHAHKADTSLAFCDAKTLYESVESGRTIDQRTIISLLSQRNTSQVKAILLSYKQLYGHEFSKLIKQSKCGQFGRDLRIVIRCIQKPEKFFAKQLRMRNPDAREMLVRIIVTRSEKDIKDINRAFAAKTGSSLENLVRREFNGVKEKGSEAVVAILLMLIRG
ncbi:hypothetical protein BT93_A2202 [Corymbia citriodora subsp. variegata]|nr:hypothetical protein BT93_A2202 [Corymbia citriodora subsp. variegata]